MVIYLHKHHLMKRQNSIMKDFITTLYDWCNFSISYIIHKHIDITAISIYIIENGYMIRLFPIVYYNSVLRRSLFWNLCCPR
ncbi:hypothetical protein ACH3XW_12590 [Acanthocheilonema viteae]